LKFLLVLLTVIAIVLFTVTMGFASDGNNALLVGNSGLYAETELYSLGDDFVVYIGTKGVGFGLAKLNYLGNNDYIYLGGGIGQFGLQARLLYGRSIEVPLQNFILQDYETIGRLGISYNKEGPRLVYEFGIRF